MIWLFCLIFWLITAYAWFVLDILRMLQYKARKKWGGFSKSPEFLTKQPPWEPMKTLQSLTKSTLKLSILITSLSLTACASSQGRADFEPCSLADSAKPISDSEFNAAFTACKAKALSGDPISQKNLAYIYYYGNSRVQADKAQGAQWFQAAAQLGNQAAIARVQDMGTTAISYNYAQ